MSSNAYRYGYQGQEKEAEGNWSNFELRMYDADLGRWLAPDPMGQHFSPYLAMSNNPVLYIDPSGGEDKYDISIDIDNLGLSPRYSNYYDYYEDLIYTSWAGDAEGDVQRMRQIEEANTARSFEKTLAQLGLYMLSPITVSAKDGISWSDRRKLQSEVNFIQGNLSRITPEDWASLYGKEVSIFSPVDRVADFDGFLGQLSYYTNDGYLNGWQYDANGYPTGRMQPMGGAGMLEWIGGIKGVKGGLGLADDVAGVLSKGDYLRIQNAATKINKPITLVGSRASGKAGALSDWDYVIQGGLKSREWSKIKNSLPGARSVLDNTVRNIDILPGPVWPGYPHITIYPR